jgi:hypothetical protein
MITVIAVVSTGANTVGEAMANQTPTACKLAFADDMSEDASLAAIGRAMRDRMRPIREPVVRAQTRIAGALRDRPTM